MPDALYLGLAGQAGAGKDFCYQYLKDYSSYEVDRVAFADGVRLEVIEYLGVPASLVWTKPYPYEVRRLLQWWGTELRRADDPDYWVKKGMEQAAKLASTLDNPIIVFTDVRFENEAGAIRDAGGLVLEVQAPAEVRRQRTGIDTPAHASEVIDFETDGIILNSRDGGDPEFGGWRDILGL